MEITRSGQPRQQERNTKTRREQVKKAFIEAARQFAEQKPDTEITFMQGLITGWTGKTTNEILKELNEK